MTYQHPTWFEANFTDPLIGSGVDSNVAHSLMDEVFTNVIQTLSTHSKINETDVDKDLVYQITISIVQPFAHLLQISESHEALPTYDDAIRNGESASLINE